MPVIILGGGGHAKVLVETLWAASLAVAGIVDPDPALWGGSVLGVPVLGGDEVVLAYAPDLVRLVNGLGSTGLPQLREAIFERFAARGFAFAAVVHPLAVIARDVELGEGAQVMAGAVIQPGSRLGRNALVNTRASVDHDCLIGDHVHLAPGVTLSGGVTVGAGAHIGTGATVIQGIRIGGGSLIAAGAVVISDIPAGSVAMGVPAKVVLR